MNIEEEFWEIAKARFECMPENIRIAIGGFGELDKKKILEHLERRDDLGKLLVKMQINYLTLFKREAEWL